MRDELPSTDFNTRLKALGGATVSMHDRLAELEKHLAELAERLHNYTQAFNEDHQRLGTLEERQHSLVERLEHERRRSAEREAYTQGFTKGIDERCKAIEERLKGMSRRIADFNDRLNEALPLEDDDD